MWGSPARQRRFGFANATVMVPGPRLVHHGSAHWFSARARWCPDTLGPAVAAMIVGMFLPPEFAVEVVVDDILFRRYGRTVHAVGWQHDGSAPGRYKFGYGNCWVIAGIVVWLPA
ncbi:transposase [Micromonospora sp. ATCC 39149]|uniref:Transposase n=1 Tax=Micromonospora carbonacea TaxID=47853 RepID=A0A7D6CGN0_9ACTN|nr:transposase [Micromonospora sp. ATCC 39149]QLK01022.1 transposase [Micromonospora carbonacea]